MKCQSPHSVILTEIERHFPAGQPRDRRMLCVASSSQGTAIHPMRPPLKLLLRHPFYVGKVNRLLAQKAAAMESAAPPRTSAPPIGLDLYTPNLLFDGARHLQTLSQQAHLAGSHFYVRGESWLLSSVVKKTFGRNMVVQPSMTWLRPDRPFPLATTVLIDVPHDALDPDRSSDRSFTRRPPPPERRIEMLIGKDRDVSDPVMPYPMHPATIPHAAPVNIRRWRSAHDRRAMLFAGRQQGRHGRATMGARFGVATRLQILDALKRLDGKDVAMPIIIRDSDRIPIEAPDWLPFLARHSFFICCPGVAQPMCHNIVEAMSVGTIPLVEYGDRMTPKLVDGETAICFSGVDGLRSAVHRIRRLSKTQLRKMSENVSEYYDEHLRGDLFLASLRDQTTLPSDAKLWMPFHDTNFFDDHAHAFPPRPEAS
ncbi:MAG: hypothetical protein AAF989_07025, partial [Planctomycetota bacterium]